MFSCSKPNKPQVAAALFYLVVLVALDQISKYFALQLIPEQYATADHNRLLSFQIAMNQFGFMGLFSPIPESVRAFILTYAIGAILVAGGAFLLLGKYPYRMWLPIMLLLGGGGSNLLDRFFHNGAVVDFIILGYPPFQTGIFNLADVFIICGAFIAGAEFYQHR